MDSSPIAPRIVYRDETCRYLGGCYSIEPASLDVVAEVRPDGIHLLLRHNHGPVLFLSKEHLLAIDYVATSPIHGRLSHETVTVEDLEHQKELEESGHGEIPALSILAEDTNGVEVEFDVRLGFRNHYAALVFLRQSRQTLGVTPG